jgi:hypothetical protein
LVSPWNTAGPIRWVLVKDPSGRREPQAFMSTNVNLETALIIAYFVRRWKIEVTFAETRALLGVETQRQWNDKAIMRTAPSLLALYSLVHSGHAICLAEALIPMLQYGTRKRSSPSPMPSVPFA